MSLLSELGQRLSPPAPKQSQLQRPEVPLTLSGSLACPITCNDAAVMSRKHFIPSCNLQVAACTIGMRLWKAQCSTNLAVCLQA